MMKNSRNLRRYRWMALPLLVALPVALFASPIRKPGGAETGAAAFYDRLYAESLRNLQHGNVYEKIHAITVLGAHRKSNFVRPMSRELLKDLDNANFRLMSTNDPFIKSHLAWALGNIGHRHAVPALNQALEQSVAIVDEQLELSRARREALAPDSGVVVLDVDRPGPTRLGPNVTDADHPFPASPDVYWSVADTFKHLPAADQYDEQVWIQLKGYNYANLIVNLFDALGKVAQRHQAMVHYFVPQREIIELLDSVRESVTRYINHDLPAVRGGAVLALGRVGGVNAMASLAERFEQEEDPWVRARLSRAILMNDRTQVAHFQAQVENLTHDNGDVRLEAAQSFRELRMGESIVALKRAYDTEEHPVIRSVLEEAVFNAALDNVLPVIY